MLWLPLGSVFAYPKRSKAAELPHLLAVPRSRPDPTLESRILSQKARADSRVGIVPNVCILVSKTCVQA